MLKLWSLSSKGFCFIPAGKLEEQVPMALRVEMSVKEPTHGMSDGVPWGGRF